MLFTDAITGPSSNIAFTRHISLAVVRLFQSGRDNTTPRSIDSLPIDGGLMYVSRPASPARESSRQWHIPNVDLYALPPGDESTELVHRYFSNTGLLFPYLDEEVFMETYQTMKESNFTRIRKTWLGLFNMVLAFAISTTVSAGLSAEKRTEMSDLYYQRALGLCGKDMFRGSSVELGVCFSLICSQLWTAASADDVSQFQFNIFF
jgi:hypothetical protein